MISSIRGFLVNPLRCIDSQIEEKASAKINKFLGSLSNTIVQLEKGWKDFITKESKVVSEGLSKVVIGVEEEAKVSTATISEYIVGMDRTIEKEAKVVLNGVSGLIKDADLTIKRIHNSITLMVWPKGESNNIEMNEVV